MTEALIDFPTIETVPMPAAAPPIAAVAKTTAIADSISAVHGEVAKFDQIAAGLARIEAAHPKNVIVADIATSAGFKVAETGWRAYRNPRLEVERARKAAKAPVLALGKAIDTFAGDLETRLRDGEDHYKAQIDAEETRRAAEKAEAARIEAERVAKHQAGIAKIGAYLTRCQEPGMTADRISIGIGMLEGVKFGPEWEEFAVPAANAQCETLEAMRILHAQATEREAEAARLEAQRVENERVAREQAEQRAELDRQAAVLIAAQKRIATVQARIAEIRAAATGHEKASAADLREAAVAVAALDVSEAQYAEFAALAQAERATTLAVLEKLHADAVAAEDKRAAELQEVVDAAKQMANAIASVPVQPLLQDECKGLSVALATKPDAPMHAREAAAAIEPAPVLSADEVASISTLVVAPPMAGTVTAEELPIGHDPQAAFLALVMSAFDCKFPSHPKPSIAWWAAVRKAGEELQGAA
jgi:hypothetical protein